MKDLDRQALADQFLVAAREASDVIMSYYRGDYQVEIKEDSSPATEADRQAEAVIVKRLQAFDAALPIVAEEAVSAGRIPNVSERFVLVDPLDGTKEFIKQRTDFTVNIALIEDGVPVLGVLAAPARDELFVGERGTGAWTATLSNATPNWSPIHTRQPTLEELVVVASLSHLSDETKEFIERFQVKGFSGAGSSIKFCQVARGEADLYPRLGRTMEWDTAAGDAVLRAAGGRVETLDGKPLRYGKRNQADDTDFANPYFVAAAFDWASHLKQQSR